MDMSQNPGDAPEAGAALGALDGGLGSVALDLAPEIGRWLFGPDAAVVAAAVQQAAQAATGTGDPAAQVAALADPAVAARLRLDLAALAAARAAAAEARLASNLADVAGARAMAAQLAQSGGPMAWGAPIMSLVVLATFGTVMGLVLLHAIPTGSETVLNVLLGTLGAMATNVVSYWVGSSAGSARKDARLAQRTE